jgi:hypothetical protein
MIRNSNFEGFKKETPASISSEFFNLQKEVGKTVDVNEANQDSRFIEPDSKEESTEDIM